MYQLFNSAVTKIKRIDFLKTVIKKKAEESGALTGEAAVLRKKNGWADRLENDVRLYRINAQIAAADKSVAECKEEIKKLKNEALDELADAYPKATTAEHREKVRAAVRYLTDGKTLLYSDVDAGGVEGETQIVGVVTTQDKKKRGEVARLVKAGLVSDTGKVVERPKICAYVYSKDEPEGIEKEADDTFKKKTRRAVREKKKADGRKRFFGNLKTSYVNINSVYVIAIFAIYAVFTLWATLSGLSDTAFYPLRNKLPIALAIAFCAYAVFALFYEKRGGFADKVALFLVLASIVDFVCLAFAENPVGRLVKPVLEIVCGLWFMIFGSAVRFTRTVDGKEACSTVYAKIFSLFSGVLLACVVAAAPVSAYFYSLFGAITFAATCFAVLLFALKHNSTAKVGSYLSAAFYLTAFAIADGGTLFTVLYGTLGAAMILCLAINKFRRQGK